MSKFFTFATPGAPRPIIRLDAIVEFHIEPHTTVGRVAKTEERRKSLWRRLWTGWKNPMETIETTEEVWGKEYRILAAYLPNGKHYELLARTPSLELAEKMLAELRAALEAS